MCNSILSGTDSGVNIETEVVSPRSDSDEANEPAAGGFCVLPESHYLFSSLTSLTPANQITGATSAVNSLSLSVTSCV